MRFFIFFFKQNTVFLKHFFFFIVKTCEWNKKGTENYFAQTCAKCKKIQKFQNDTQNERNVSIFILIY